MINSLFIKFLSMMLSILFQIDSYFPTILNTLRQRTCIVFFKLFEESCHLWKLDEYWSNCFTSFISSEVFHIHFFVFVIGKLIVYQYFFDIYIAYIDCFLRKMELVSIPTWKIQKFLNHFFKSHLEKNIFQKDKKGRVLIF